MRSYSTSVIIVKGSAVPNYGIRARILKLFTLTLFYTREGSYTTVCYISEATLNVRDSSVSTRTAANTVQLEKDIVQLAQFTVLQLTTSS